LKTLVWRVDDDGGNKRNLLPRRETMNEDNYGYEDFAERRSEAQCEAYAERVDALVQEASEDGYGYEDFEDFMMDYLGEREADIVIDAVVEMFGVSREVAEREAESIYTVWSRCDAERTTESQTR
jgi:hypothetical protein